MGRLKASILTGFMISSDFFRSLTYFMSVLGVILLVLACGCLMKRHTHYAAGDLADVPVVPELTESA